MRNEVELWLCPEMCFKSLPYYFPLNRALLLGNRTFQLSFGTTITILTTVSGASTVGLRVTCDTVIITTHD